MTELEGATKTVESEAAETATAVATDGVGLAAVAIAAAVEGLAVAADVAEEEPPNGRGRRRRGGAGGAHRGDGGLRTHRRPRAHVLARDRARHAAEGGRRASAGPATPLRQARRQAREGDSRRDGAARSGRRPPSASCSSGSRASRSFSKQIVEFLAIDEPMTLRELLTNAKLRASIDGEVNLEMLESVC